jgi:hypothetical protein
MYTLAYLHTTHTHTHTHTYTHTHTHTHTHTQHTHKQEDINLLVIFGHCRSTRSHLLCGASADTTGGLGVELCARPLAFASQDSIGSATSLLRRVQRPVDLILAGAGRHSAASVQHAMTAGFNPHLLRSLDLSRSCLSGILIRYAQVTYAGVC